MPASAPSTGNTIPDVNLRASLLKTDMAADQAAGGSFLGFGRHG
jgi:hypothetical protein